MKDVVGSRVKVQPQGRWVEGARSLSVLCREEVGRQRWRERWSERDVDWGGVGIAMMLVGRRKRRSKKGRK